MASQQTFSTNTGLSEQPEFDQKKDPQLYAELVRIRSAIRVMQGAVDVYTGNSSEESQFYSQTPATSTIRVQGVSKLYVQATEAISLGQVVNLYDNSGTLGARLASAIGSKPVMGYCSESNGITSGALGEITLLGLHPYITSIIPGNIYYLATTPGFVTNVSPSGSGQIVQELGFGITINSFWFNPILDWVTLP